MKTLFAILILIISFQSRCFAINIVTSLNGGNCSLVTAENNTILNQNESLIVKSLTKTTKTKKIFIREEIDGFRYFLLQDKYGLIGIADLEGKLIIPIENKAIYYFPALSKGYCNIEYIDEKSTIEYIAYLFHPETKATFFCQNTSDCVFYSTTGKTFNRTKSTEISILPGYVIAGDNYLSIGCSYSDIYISTSLYGSRNNIHLYTYDGTVFVENSNEIRLCLNTYSKEDSFVKYGHRIAATGIATKYGAFKLENKSDSIPCQFDDISIFKKEWFVSQTSMDKSEKYIANQNYGYRDKGQEYYEQKKYDDVINFYAKEGIKASWAKFYTGVSLYKKGMVEIDAAKSCIGLMNKYDETQSFSFDLDIAKQLLSTSIASLEAYIKEDTIYASWAETYRNFAEESLKEIPTIEKKYSLALNALKERREEARLAEIQRKREEQQRKIQERKALLVGILSGFTEALLSNSVHTNSSQSSYNSGSRISNTSSSSSNKDNVHRQEWMQRKSNAEKQLNYYQEKLKKDPNNAALKHNIRKQQEIIQNCNTML